MALSNWAICAWDEKGKMTDGSFKVGNVEIELYKNWAYLRDRDAWVKDNASFIEPTIAQINSGEVIYKALGIYAKTGIGNAIYLVVEYHDFKNKIDRNMFGIGCYAFDSKNGHIGVRKNVFNDFVKWIKKLNNTRYIKTIIPKNPRWFNQGDIYLVGGKIEGRSYPIGKIGKETIFEKLISKIK